MAQIDARELLPTERPSTNGPDPAIRLNVSPNAFGGAVAKGTEEFGADAFRAGDHWGAIAADDMANQYSDAATKILHGDPSKTVTNPDGTTGQDLGYLGLKGRAALDARPATEKQLDDLYKQTVGKLGSFDQRRTFDDITRRYRNVVSSQMGTHADTQANAYAIEVNRSAVKVSAQTISANPDNEDIFLHSTADMIDAATKAAEVRGAQKGDAIWQTAVNDAKAAAAETRIRAVGVKDPVAAAAMADHYKDVLGPHYAPIADHFRTRAEDEGADAVGAGVFREVTGKGAAVPAGAAGPSNPNNIGNVRPKGGGDDSGFVQVKSFDEGVKLTVDNARAYPKAFNDGKPMSIEQISQHWTKNDKAIWAKNVADNSGLPINTPVDLNDPQVAAQFARGVHAAEWKGSPRAVPVRPVADYLPGASGTPGEAVSLNAPPDLKEQEDAKAILARQAEDGIKRIDNMNLPPKQYIRAVRAFREAMSTHEIAESLREKAQQSAATAGMDEYIKSMAPGQPVPGDIVQRITNDPRFNHNPQIREHLIELAKKHAGSDVAEATQAYGPGFWDAYKKVVAPTGDPDRIADPSQLLSRAGPNGDLTLSGVQKLMGTMQQAQRSVNDHSVANAKVGLLNYAKGKLSFEQETGPIKIRDPKGEAIFNGRFIPKFEAAYDEWTKAGKDPWQFLSQENVDKLIQGMRNPAEMARDRLAASGELPIQPATSVPPAPEGVNADGWKTIVGQPPQTVDGRIYQGWAKAVETLRQNPTPEYIKQFDAKFGASGYKAQEIIDSLNKGAPKPPLPNKELERAQAARRHAPTNPTANVEP